MTAWFRLFRIQNALIAIAGVWLGWFATRAAHPSLLVAIWGSLSMALLTMAGNADNDVCDLEEDRVNRPGRPLAAGLLKASRVRIAAFGLYAFGIFAATIASPLHGLLALGMTLLLLAYNRFLKGLPLVGNFAVAFLCALAIYFPEFPALIHSTLPAFVFAFLATLAREVVKDAEDVEGDRAAKLRTLPLMIGVNGARKLAFSLTAILFAALPLPVLLFGYRWPYLVLSTVLAGPFLIALLLELMKPAADYSRCQRYFKWMMLGGMLALLAGTLSS